MYANQILNTGNNISIFTYYLNTFLTKPRIGILIFLKKVFTPSKVYFLKV